MGNAVKAVAGIAIAIYAPYLVSAYAGWAGVAFTAGGYYAAVGAVTLVGASLAGGAMASGMPDVGDVDSYAGQKLQTKKDNVSAVPLVFGENRLGSSIIWQATDDALGGNNNCDYWSIQVVSEATINSFEALYANEDSMVDKGSDKYTLAYVHCKGYTTSGASGMNLNDVEFVTTQAGATQTGSSLGLTNFTIPPNVAFIATHQEYKAADNKHTQLDNVTVKIQGKKIKQINASTLGSEIYSNNPAECVLDVLMNGLNISESDIDIPSFYNVKTKSNTYGYTSNIVFNQQRNMQSTIRDLLTPCRGQIVYSQGKWKLKIDEKLQTVYKDLTDDDILNSSLNISMKGFQEIANKIILKYVNPNDSWLSAKVEKEDTDLVGLDGQSIEMTLDIKGITNTAQANKLAEITLNTIRYTEDISGNRIKQTPLAINFATTIKNADLEVGDIISLEHSLLDRVRKFVILSVETDQSGAIQISAREYSETHFKDNAGNYLI